MDISAIVATAATSITIIKEALNISKELKGDTESLEKIDVALARAVETQGLIYDLQGELLKIQSHNAKLQKQIDNHDVWNSKLEEYKIRELAHGAVVYQNKENSSFCICPSCTNEKRIEFLQMLPSNYYQCPKCKAMY